MRTSQALFMLTLLLFCSTSLLAQTKRTISGTVSDSRSGVVIGATVLEKGTRNATLTDEHGFYKLAVSPGSTLVISFVGLTTRELPVGTSSTINVTLEDGKAMNEVVVTGFGDRSKRTTGFASTTVSGDDIRRTANPNPIAALQGMVPGLQVTPNVGGPQASVRFQIRGSASLDPYGNQPLVVVDDIVMDDQVILPNRGGEQDFGNILKDINPDDIESVTVLKGGAVTALYGSRASNGVILIKTKKGFSQRGLGVSFSQSLMFEEAYKTVDLQNRFGAGIHANDWSRLTNDTLAANTSTYFLSFGPEMNGQLFKDISGQYRPNSAGANDPLSLYGTGVNRNTNIGISGGNDRTTFRFSYSNFGATSATPNNELNRNSFSFRATHRPVKGVLLDVNTSYTQSRTDNPALQGGNALIYATSYGVPRNYDIRYWMNNYIDTALGGYTNRDVSDASGSFWYLYQNHYRMNEGNLRASFNMRADLTPWLRFDGNASVNTIESNYYAKVRGRAEKFQDGDYTTENKTISQYRYRGSLNFMKKVERFDILFQAGGELNQSNMSGLWTSTNGFIRPDVFRISNSKNPAEVRESKPNDMHMGSLFFQGTIGFNDYLSLNLYGRNDWNSTLVYNDGHGNYSYFYPGADLAFVFTDLFKLPKAFDFGKLRMSYVEAGGGTIPYFANTGAYTSIGVYTDAAGGSIIRYGMESTLPNQALNPIRNKKIETGLELKFFGNRLGADFTYYTQDSKNQIQGFDVDPSSGVRQALVNGGMVRNKGIELSLYGTPLKIKDFSWDVMFNYTRNRNTIMSLALGAKYALLEGNDGIYSVAFPGGDYGTILSNYDYAYYQAKDGSGANVESPLNGQRIVTFNATGGLLGNPVLFYQRSGNYNPGVGREAEQKVGTTQPKFLGSMRHTFNYKRVALSVFLDSKIGGSVYSTTLGYGSQYGMLNRTLYGRTAELGGLTYTSTTNYNGQTPGQRNDGILPQGVFQAGTVIPASASADGQSHDVGGMSVAEAYEKGFIKPTPAADYYDRSYGWGSGIRSASMFESSWVSMREVSVSYDLPVQVAEKIKMNSLRASLIGRNLLFLYNSAPDHVNPDNLSSTNAGGFVENGGTPYFRQFGFSINATF